MSYKIGAVSTARIDDDAITAAKIATDAVVADGIAADAVGASEIAADAVGASEIAANAVGASELADNAVDTDAVVNAAITSEKLASTISIADLTVTGDLSVVGNTSSITLEEVQVDQAKIILNREDSTSFGSLSGNIGLVVKGGTDKDIKMVFDKPAGQNGRVNFKDEDDAFIPLKAANIEGSSVTCTGNLTLGSGANEATYASGSGTITAPAFSGPLTGNVTGNVSGSSGSCTGNSATASAFQSAMTLSLAGDLSGSVSFDGSSTATLTAAIGANSLELGTATTGNYVATVAAASGTDAISVSGSGSETAAVTLAAHGLLESAVDSIAGSGFAGGQEYLALATAADTMSATQLSSIGKSLIGAMTNADVRTQAGLGNGYTAEHGDLDTANQRLIEQDAVQKPGHGSYSNISSGFGYKAYYNLDASDASSQETFSLPAIDDSDSSGTKFKHGMKMVVKLSALGSGASVRLGLPSGANASTKIDGANFFDLDEVNQAVTICALPDKNGVSQYFII